MKTKKEIMFMLDRLITWQDSAEGDVIEMLKHIKAFVRKCKIGKK